MSKRLIGYGYTNANGVATLDYDAEGNELQSSGYVGQGVGNVDISASAVIDGSTFVSGTLPVLDCTFYDTGIQGTANPNWVLDSNGQLNRLTEYSQIIETGTSNCIFRIKENNAQKQFNNNMMIELDVKQVDGTNSDTIIDLRANGTGLTGSGLALSNFGFNDNNWHTIKIKLEENLVSAMVGNTVISTKTPTVTATYWLIGLWTAGTTTELHFKNVKVYPI